MATAVRGFGSATSSRASSASPSRAASALRALSAVSAAPGGESWSTNDAATSVTVRSRSFSPCVARRKARTWSTPCSLRSPGEQVRQRVDRLRRLARVPAVGPDLEVQVRAVRGAGRADGGELLAGRHALALLDGERAVEQVHEHVVAGVVAA